VVVRISAALRVTVGGGLGQKSGSPEASGGDLIYTFTSGTDTVTFS
jgi:hypothetical protein